MIMLRRVDVRLPFNSFRAGSPIQKDIAAFLSVIFARSFPSSHTGFLLLPPRLRCSHSLLPSAGHVRSVWEPKSNFFGSKLPSQPPIPPPRAYSHKSYTSRIELAKRQWY